MLYSRMLFKGSEGKVTERSVVRSGYKGFEGMERIISQLGSVFERVSLIDWKAVRVLSR